MTRIILGFILISTALVVSAVCFSVANPTVAAPGLRVTAPSDGTLRFSTSTTSALFSFNDMMPGDRVTAPLIIHNDGTLDLRYAVASIATNDDGKGLMNQLQLMIKTWVSACTNSGFTADDTILYGPAPLGSMTGLNVVGDPTIGYQTGDRTLRSNTSETLCFSVLLPLSTPNAFAGATTSATFKFVAEAITP